MDNPVDNYWHIRLKNVEAALEKNNFEVYLVNSSDEAKAKAFQTIIPKIQPQSLSWGGSMTFTTTGLYDALKNKVDLKILDTFDKTVSNEEKFERYRQALSVDLFITGTNAVTEAGQLINLDMVGNRVGALTFGPKYVLVLVGRNKVVSDVQNGIDRIKRYAAPANAMRLDKNTPCIKTGDCEECQSSGRICNTWTITEKSFPQGRIKVILINEDLGL